MPGPYPDPRSCANRALQVLEDAYAENYSSPAGSMILTAIDAIRQLKQVLEGTRGPGAPENDPYEVNYSNLAL